LYDKRKYRSLEQFLRALPEAVSLRYDNNGGGMYVHCVLDDTLQHLSILIGSQRSTVS
jgi:hypothetical protein